MRLTKTERPVRSSRLATALLPPLIPLLAASVQSFWIVIVRDFRNYQAVLNPEGWDRDVWLGVSVQVAVAVGLLWPLVKFPIPQRLVALVVFGACLYYDCFGFTRAVRR